MSLDVDEIAGVLFRWGVPEVTKANVIERGRGLEACDMAAELGRFHVGPKNDRDGIPADDGPDAMLDIAVPLCALLALGGNRINVRSVQRKRGGRTSVLRLIGQSLK